MSPDSVNLIALFFQSYIFSIDNAKAGLFVNYNIFSEVSAARLLAVSVATIRTFAAASSASCFIFFASDIFLGMVIFLYVVVGCFHVI